MHGVCGFAKHFLLCSLRLDTVFVYLLHIKRRLGVGYL